MKHKLNGGGKKIKKNLRGKVSKKTLITFQFIFFRPINHNKILNTPQIYLQNLTLFIP